MDNAQSGGGVAVVISASGQTGRIYTPVQVPEGLKCSEIIDVKVRAVSAMHRALGTGFCGTFYFTKTGNPPGQEGDGLAAHLLPTTNYIIYEDVLDAVTVNGATLTRCLVTTMNRLATWSITLPAMPSIAPVLMESDDEMTPN
jgi:hypothetical protein